MIVSHRPAPSRQVHPDLLAPPLAASTKADVCIVGAGLAAMLSAYELARSGLSVIVVDEGSIGSGRTGLEPAPFGTAQPPRRRASAQEAGSLGVAPLRRAAAFDVLEGFVRRERLFCEFERLDGYWFGAGVHAREEIEHERAVLRQSGIDDIEWLESVPIAGLESAPCLRYPRQAHFHPLKFFAGLARAITRAGGRLHCGVCVRSIEAGNPARIVTMTGHQITARIVLSPVPNTEAPLVTHMIGIEVPRGTMRRAIYWDGEMPNHWMRLRSGTTPASELLLVGGEDRAAGIDDASRRHHAIEQWARARFPNAGAVVLRHSGEVLATPDYVAVAARDGCDSESVYMASGGTSDAADAAAFALAVRDFADTLDLPNDFPRTPGTTSSGASVSQIRLNSLA